jgi:type IV pilus assembly protein PilV
MVRREVPLSIQLHKQAAFRPRQRGVSMVEALVALLVMSIGMLGIAGLYVSSLQANRTALLRTQAVSLVNDMLDRMRANPMARGQYDLSKYGTGPKDQNCVAAANNCSYTKLAEDDLYRWQESVKALLPGTPTTSVKVVESVKANTPDNYIVKVTWTEPTETASFSYQGALDMIPVTP